jgi:hypothetical protein
MKVALMGTAPSSMELAPFDDPDWEIWACSPGCMYNPRADVYFDLHRYLPGGVSFPFEYCDFLKNFEGRVWMTQVVEEIPNSEEFPWEELVEKYGPYFFTSSLSWMMAMAIEMGATEIGLWGVDMAAATEYKDQKLGCQYFSTLAVAKGIKVTVPPESDLFRPNPLYGVCQSSHEWIKYTSKVKEFNSAKADADRRAKQAEIEAHAWTLAKEALDYYGQTWAGDMNSGDYTTPPKVPALVELA